MQANTGVRGLLLLLLFSDVERVVQYWAQSYNERQRIYCGFIDRKKAGFCLIEDMGIHDINGRKQSFGNISFYI